MFSVSTLTCQPCQTSTVSTIATKTFCETFCETFCAEKSMKFCANTNSVNFQVLRDPGIYPKLLSKSTYIKLSLFIVLRQEDSRHQSILCPQLCFIGQTIS